MRDLVQDTIQTQNLSNIVPLDITHEATLRATWQAAAEYVVTAVTERVGDPCKTGSLLFNLQFDRRPEEYPTPFRVCKLSQTVRDYIKTIVADNLQSGFARLPPQLGEELPQRIRCANQLLNDHN